MSLKDKLQSDLKVSLKAGDSFKVGVLRMVLSSVHNKEIDKKVRDKELADEEVSEILRKEAKKRREAADIYLKNSRNDLGDKELDELKIIQSYLPSEIDPREIEVVVRKIIDSGTRDFGTIMKESMRDLKGKAEAGTVSEIVKKLLV